MLQCLRRTGHLLSFFVPIPGNLTAQESLPSGILIWWRFCLKNRQFDATRNEMDVHRSRLIRSNNLLLWLAEAEYIWTKIILCEPSIIYTRDSIQLVKDKDVSVQSGHSDTFLVRTHTRARALCGIRKEVRFTFVAKTKIWRFPDFICFVKSRIETKNRQHEEPYIYSKKTKTSKTVWPVCFLLIG